MLTSIATKFIRRSSTSAKFGARALSTFPPPRLFDYDTVTKNLTVADAITSVEEAFAALAKGNVDVPMPMHIGIGESPVAGPGDCHIKGTHFLSTLSFLLDLKSFFHYYECTHFHILIVLMKQI